MVSFSCDACQNVFTKPKVERHFQSCNTRSVSCIDCGVVFNSQSIRGHTSCITEEEKFGPKGGDACTQGYCGICKLQLNGSVHALQHYDSKKHRAAVRRRGGGKKVGQEGVCGGTTDGGTSVAARREAGVCKDTESGEGNGGKGVRGLTRVIKKALLGAKKQRLKKKRLLKAVAELLGEKAPGNLERLLERKIGKSKRFVVRKDRVKLAESTVKS